MRKLMSSRSPVSARYAETLSEVRGPVILDVGIAGQVDFQPERKDVSTFATNPGWMHGLLLERFEKVHGFDIDQGTVDELTGQGIANLTCQDAETFTYDGLRFDTIVAGEVIEHLGNAGAFLEQCRKHLGTGGRLVLTTPNPFSILYVLRSWLRWPRTNPNPEHVQWFCPGMMFTLAERYGFSISNWRSIPDYEPAAVVEPYGIFQVFIKATRYLLPARMRHNSVLYVLSPTE